MTPPQARPPGPARILVVDDDPTTRSLLRFTLDDAGFDVLEAESGDQALRRLVAEDVDAVLLDRVMPDMDGVEVLRWIRRTPSTAQTPVLFVTALDQVEDLVEGLGIGADDYVFKPFDPDALVARLRRHLRGRSEWDEIVRREVERRVALVEAAASSATPSVEVAVTQLCDSLLHLPGVRGVAVAELFGDVVAALGGKGDDPLAVLRSHRGPHHLGRHLRERAVAGPWIELASERGEATLVPAAPVRAGDAVVALLVALPERDATRTDIDRLHASVIDFAALASGVFGASLLDSARRDEAHREALALADRREFAIAYQPIVDLRRDESVGYEALARFDDGREPLEVFLHAGAVGAGHTLELAALDAAIEGSAHLPADHHLSVNVSPSLLVHRDIGTHLRQADDRTIVVELSELEPVADYARLRAALEKLGTNVMLSVDDAGSGFASLAHILALDATYVKLDRSWIRRIDRDAAKRALVAGIQNFAGETGATVIAEGIETEAELDTVRRLGIPLGQGFLLGRPATA